MREAEFQKWVVDVATLNGWRCWHVPAPMVNRKGTWVGAKQAAGIPDLILMHDDPPRMIFAEIKGTGGKPSEEQLEFLRMAQGVGNRSAALADHVGWDDATPAMGAYLWQPGMEQQIEDILRSRVLS